MAARLLDEAEAPSHRRVRSKLATARQGTLGRDVVVGVDNAHLLDELSAALVHQLVLRCQARVVRVQARLLPTMFRNPDRPTPPNAESKSAKGNPVIDKAYSMGRVVGAHLTSRECPWPVPGRAASWRT